MDYQTRSPEFHWTNTNNYSDLTEDLRSDPRLQNWSGWSSYNRNLWNSSQLDSFWTPYHRYLMKNIPWEVHVTMGIIVGCIVMFGITANSIVLYVFYRFKRLRTPANVFIMNLTISDLGACLLHPLASYSSFQGAWAFGRIGCNLYGMGVGFFGLNSIITLTAIAFERYIVITSKPAGAKWKITRRQVKKICVGIWLHCLALVVPPLFGWSAYVPEGLLTSCSWDYSTRSLSNRLYYIYLLVFGFAIPVVIIIVSYWSIFRFIILHTREMTQLTTDSLNSFRKSRKKTDVMTAQIILTLALLFFLAWTPYSVVSLIGQFGPVDALSPLATAVPAYFAKTAVIMDPIVYGFSHQHFRSSIRQLFHSLNNSNNSTVRIELPVGALNERTVFVNSPIRPVKMVLSQPGTQRNSIARLEHTFSSRYRRSIHNMGKAHPKRFVSEGDSTNTFESPVIFSRRARNSVPRLTTTNVDRPKSTSNKSKTRSRSVPNLLQSNRIIHGGYFMDFDEYRRSRHQLIRKILFASDSRLDTINADSDLTRANQPCPSFKSRCSTSSKSILNGYGDLTINYSCHMATRLSNCRTKKSPPVMTKKSLLVHNNCCECAYDRLRKTVTLANIPTAKAGKTRHRGLQMLSSPGLQFNSSSSSVPKIKTDKTLSMSIIMAQI